MVCVLPACSRALIPAEDFAVVLKYAQAATTKGSLFVLAEGVHANYTAHFTLDVRAAADYAAGHIPGAVNVPYAQVFTKDGLARLPQDRPIAVVCYTGQSAGIVTALLTALGYDAVDMSFGMAAWRKSTDVHVWTAAAAQPIYGANYEEARL